MAKKLLWWFLFCAIVAWFEKDGHAQPALTYILQPFDPPSACANGSPTIYNWLNNKEWGCNNGTRVVISGGGGATIPMTTNLISGDGAGNGANSGIAPANVPLLNATNAFSNTNTFSGGLVIPASAGASGTASGAFKLDTTTNTLRFGNGSASSFVALGVTGTLNDCVQWSGVAYTLADANAACILSGTTAGGNLTGTYPNPSIGASQVTLGMHANLAANSIIGNNTGSPATPIALTQAQVAAMLNTQALFTLTTTGTSGASTYSGGTLNIPNYAGGGYSRAVNTQTFSATPAYNLSLGQVQTITLTGNVTSSTFTNGTAGEFYTFIICQDGTGGRTYVFGAAWHGAMTIGSTLSLCSVQEFAALNATTLYAVGPGIINQ